MKRTLIAVTAAVWSLMAGAQVSVTEPWVRATFGQQKTTGAFFQLQSAQDAKLVAATSSVAGITEVHEMSMVNGIMKMRQVPAIALPAGKPVELKPGGYHVMLMELKNPIKVGDTVPLTLVVENADGSRQNIDVNAVAKGMVRPMRKSEMPSEGHGDHKH